MARRPSVKKVERKGGFYHVRIRDPSRFTRIRTLTNTSDGRVRAARSCRAHGVKVGKSRRSGNWLIQGVLVRRKRGRDRNDAANAARCTVAKVEG